VWIPVMSISDSDLMPIMIPAKADRCRSEATVDSSIIGN
jgi:hypothetical protein